MIILTNSSETRFFLNDDHVKNLHEIEVNSIADLLNKKVCKVSHLLKQQSLQVDELGEIVTLDYEGLDIPPNGFEFPFMYQFSFAEVVEQSINQIIESQPDKASGIAEAKSFIRELEVNYSTVHQIGVSLEALIFVTPDGSKLIIRVNDESIDINPADFEYPDIEALTIKSGRGLSQHALDKIKEDY